MKYIILIFALVGCSNTARMSYVIPPVKPIDTAVSMIGLHEVTSRKEIRDFIGLDPVQYQWCAAFVNSVLEYHDIPGSESVSQHPLLARSFLKWGERVTEPEFGDIVIFTRNNSNWQGHVGFYIESAIVDGVPSYIVLGGNQDDEIKYKAYPISRLLGIRRIP